VTSDDSAWRRPASDPATGVPDRPAPPRPKARNRSGYAGPPPTVAPPAGWRPPVVYQPPPPRELPAQDLQRLDATEREARTVTYGVGLVAAAVMLLLLLVLCGRALF
jgi:hypothetical protein